MDKKTVLHIVEWGIALAACVWLVWKIATYEDYAALGECLRAMGCKEWGALALALALMPVNMALEAWRWYSLMNEGVKELKSERLSFREAQRQVYYSKMAGVITPWRLGEYPARGVLMNESQESGVKSQDVWSKVLSMGVVGSATMTAAIVGTGAFALAFSPSVLALLEDSYLYALMAVMAVLAIGLYFAPQALRKWAEVNGTLLWKSIAQSVLRLACWCVQLGLVIFALSSLRYDVMTLLRLSFIYYLLVTITPNVPIVEVGVRGAWAIAVFGTMNAALAGVLLWVINTLLPCIIWLFIRKKE